MGIKFHCPNGHRLNVKAFLAGKTGICPKCGVRVEIPLASEGNSAAPTTAQNASFALPNSQFATSNNDARVSPSPAPHQAAVDPIRENPAASWYVRSASGDEYGPATGEV